MNQDAELDALLRLIDDPDQEIFEAVSSRILVVGQPMIPRLEHLWETDPNQDSQHRIQSLLQRLYYQDLKTDILHWANTQEHDLMAGALCLSRYVYPDLDFKATLREIDKLKRAIWLELNNFLTPLEQVNVMNSIVYNYFGAKGHLVEYNNENDFLIHHLVSTKKGNQLALEILYADLCQQLDISVYPISLPGQFVLAYFKKGEYKEKGRKEIQFYIDPINGGIFSQNDCDYYLKRVEGRNNDSIFHKLSNKQIIYHLILEYSKCFSNKDFQKEQELQELASELFSHNCF